MNPHHRRRREGRRIQLESLETRSLLSTSGLNAITASNDVYYLYETVLERNPSQTDLSYWSGLLEEGVKPQVVYNAFVTSTERMDPVSTGDPPAVPSSSPRLHT